ncbi:IclR family transcriptional regulator [Halocatena salina]|uniref:IclR family transcriptional regulator n=1 Tax=Halocatena salina TaxID=2934340 RepID=A0A8U0A716_9EURY|nr:IclR family transcriptional regulator [Halocatena salina]UPM44991.1 IclR family transcriptional regulator [Halocatena salina]
MAEKQKSQVKTARTTLRVVEAIKELDGAGVSEAADHLGMSKSNVYKYLNTLESEGYLIKNGSTYQIGVRFLNYGEHARNRKKLYEIAAPEVHKLADETNEMANLLIEEHGMGVFLLKANSEQAVNLDTHAGMRVYLHTTALGKAILAHLPHKRVEEIVDHHGLPKAAEKTVTDRAELTAKLTEIRERGYAFDDEERLNGLRCVAMPITTTDDEVLGAISVSGPTSRMGEKRFTKDIPEKLSNAKNIIELNVEYY